MIIPFINLKAQYDIIQDEINTSITDAVQGFQFCKGREVAEFELQFGQFLKHKHCIGVGNGTDALFVALKTIGISSGDEVITPAFSWISTSETITLCGGKPVFVDVDSEYYTLDPTLLEQQITDRTKAIIAVHLYGQMARVKEIKAICTRYNLALIEDCAQAHGSTELNKYAGTFGDLAAFSFYPTKNLGAYGDGGCIVTDSDIYSERCRRLANHGALKKDDHMVEGLNSRLDTIQAAVLLTKLPYLNFWNNLRIRHAQLYGKILAGISQVVIPQVRLETTHTFHLYVIRAQHRNALKDFLAVNGIQTIIHYPQALINLPAYRHLNLSQEDFPVSNALQEDALSLPIYPELQEDQILYIGEKIKEFYKYR
jgi:dTDP-4-amino-4,6-dideoxygalactose transaminase